MAHLRGLPAIGDRFVRELDGLARDPFEKNEGLSDAEHHAIDLVVAAALGLDELETARVLEWGRLNPPPEPRAA
jgi:hypothetical protein